MHCEFNLDLSIYRMQLILNATLEQWWTLPYKKHWISDFYVRFFSSLFKKTTFYLALLVFTSDSKQLRDVDLKLAGVIALHLDVAGMSDQNNPFRCYFSPFFSILHSCFSLFLFHLLTYPSSSLVSFFPPLFFFQVSSTSPGDILQRACVLGTW